MPDRPCEPIFVRLKSNNLAAGTVLLVFFFSGALQSCLAQSKATLPQWKITEEEAQELFGGAREHKLNQALEQAKACKQPDEYPQSECLFELGLYYTDIGKISQAEQYFSLACDEKTLALHKLLCRTGPSSGTLPSYQDAKQEHEGKLHDLANCLSWLGRAYFSQKKYEEAAHAYGQAIELLDTNSDPNHEAVILPDTLLRAARVQRLLNHLTEAKKLEARAQYILRHRDAIER